MTTTTVTVTERVALRRPVHRKNGSSRVVRRGKALAMKTTSIFSSHLPAFVAVGVFSLLVGGCGGATPPAQGAHSDHEHGKDGEHGEPNHEDLTGPLGEMHDVLAPMWHTDKGPERETKTCEAASTFAQRAEAIDKNVPEAAKAKEAAYHTAAQGLVTAVGALQAECAKPSGERAEFDVKFHNVHEAFHKVMDNSR